MIKPILSLILLALFSSGSFAQSSSTGSSKSICDEMPHLCSSKHNAVVDSTVQTQSSTEKPQVSKDSVKAPTHSAKTSGRLDNGGNIPVYYGASRPVAISGALTNEVKIRVGRLLTELKPGDIINAQIKQSIKAAPGVPTPIQARVEYGRFKGSTLFGEAIFEPMLKRVLINFTIMNDSNSKLTYLVKAQALSLNGQVGLEGEHHSNRTELFLASTISSAVSGYVRASKEKEQTLLGSKDVVTPGNAVKSGVADAAEETANIYKEAVKTAPEYTETPGYIPIQIIMEQTPREQT